MYAASASRFSSSVRPLSCSSVKVSKKEVSKRSSCLVRIRDKTSSLNFNHSVVSFGINMFLGLGFQSYSPCAEIVPLLVYGRERKVIRLRHGERANEHGRSMPWAMSICTMSRKTRRLAHYFIQYRHLKRRLAEPKAVELTVSPLPVNTIISLSSCVTRMPSPGTPAWGFGY